MVGQSTCLTPRERQVLELLAQGKPFAEVAEALIISTGTVRTYVQHIRFKLAARNCAHAVFLVFGQNT